MAAASMKRAGKVSDMAARAMVTQPSSSGWRRTSSTLRGNSGSSSRKSRPLCARRDLAGARDHAAADQAGVGDGVVRRAEGAVGDQAAVRVEHAGDGVDLGGLERFFEAQRREDRRQALGQHGLAGAGRADHQDVVAAGGGDFERALGDVLAADVLEVVGKVLQLVEKSRRLRSRSGLAVMAPNAAELSSSRTSSSVWTG